MADLLGLRIEAVACPLGAVICPEDSRIPVTWDLGADLGVVEEVHQCYFCGKTSLSLLVPLFAGPWVFGYFHGLSW